MEKHKNDKLGIIIWPLNPLEMTSPIPSLRITIIPFPSQDTEGFISVPRMVSIFPIN